MKEHDAFVDLNSHKMTMFVEKEDGSYGEITTGSYMVKNYIDDYMEKMEYFRKEALKKLLASKISSIGYYIEVMDMAPADVAIRVGISTSKVKKHMTFKGFGSLTALLALKYVEIFDIPIAQLFMIYLSKNPKNTQHFKTTENPYIILTEK